MLLVNGKDTYEMAKADTKAASDIFRRIGARHDERFDMATTVKELLTAIRHPEYFVCDECKKTKRQDQTVTQRYGWPICCHKTMLEDKHEQEDSRGVAD